MADVATQDLIEVEWQFDAPELAAVRAWLGETPLPGFAVTPERIVEMRDVYFDTKDWAVYRAGFTCRVRSREGRAELTLKSMAEPEGGVRSRREITEPLAECEDGPAMAAGKCGDMLRMLAGRHPIEELFTLEQRRQTYCLSDATGALAEIALDETHVPGRNGDRSTLRRVEVEVTAEAQDRVRPFIDQLTSTCRLEPVRGSKFEAGMQAAGIAVPKVSFGPAAVREDMSTAAVAFAVLRRQLAVVVANEPGTRLGEDPEALHDMRVATRRMRAALSAFGPSLPARLQVYRLHLGKVAAALGAVRDLDVQLQRAKEWESIWPARAAALQPLEALLRERREVARRRMLALLDTRWYELVIARLGAVLRRGPAKSSLLGREPILQTAPVLVRRRRRKLVRAGRAIEPQSPPERYHEVRILAKKLRYALEFVGPVYGKPAQDLAKLLAALQDVLGDHQDAIVAVETLDTLARSAKRLPPDTLMVMGAVSERYRTQALTLRDEFPRAFGALRGDPWRDLRKLMASREADAR